MVTWGPRRCTGGVGVGVGLGLFALVLFSAPARAAPVEASRVEWRGPEALGCPPAASVEATLSAAWARRSDAVGGALRLTAEVTPRPEGGVHLQVVVEGATVRRARRLEAESCVLAARAAALIASLVLEELGTLPAAPATVTSTLAEAAVSPAPEKGPGRRPLRGVERAPAPASGRATGVVVRPFVVAGLALGLVPDASLLLRAGAHLGLGPWWLSGSLWWSSAGQAHLPGRPMLGAELRAYGGGLGLGATLVERERLLWTAEVRLDLGVLSASPLGLLEARSATRLRTALSAGTRIRSPLTTHVAITSALDGAILLSRPGFLASTGEELFRPGPLGLELSSGIELFW